MCGKVTLQMLENVSGTNKILYEKFFATNLIVRNNINVLSKTWWKGNHSENSFSFVDGKDMKNQNLTETAKEVLHNVFQLKNQELFDEKFEQAVGGDGQEWRRITRLHSSSLLALLCFYSISEHNRLEIDISENVHEKKIKGVFTKSYFERKNKVGEDENGKAHYSNMDVVLSGTTCDGKNVILFLESKFSEYLSSGKYDKISAKVYDGIYKKLDQPVRELVFTEESNKTWTINSKEKSMYCGGIKQMISHFQGIEESFIGSMCDTFDYIYLGEIVFNIPEELGKKHEKFNSYSTMYEQLAKKLNEINDEKRFHVLPNLLTYQEVFKNFDLDENVRAFYQLPLAQ